MPRRPVKANAAALVFALLVLATVAAFALAQRVKRDPLVLDRVNFTALRTHAKTPQGCRAIRVRIRFRVTRSDDATVEIIKPGGSLVATLADDEFLKRYHFFTFYWNGRNRAGALAFPGRYKLLVELLGQDRSLIPPGTIRLRRMHLGSESSRRPTVCLVARTSS
jgi:hypothetical protein